MACSDSAMLAPCGIDCGVCPILRAAQDPKEAERLAEGWRAAGQPKAEPGWFRCQGCRGERSLCWTENCQIYACCVEEKGLDFCSQCDDFACEKLLAWVGADPHHAAALARLKEMRAEAEGQEGD